ATAGIPIIDATKNTADKANTRITSPCLMQYTEESPDDLQINHQIRVERILLHDQMVSPKTTLGQQDARSQYPTTFLVMLPTY
ncbi:hypothetical protein ACVGXB_00695, partial [Enterobacter intestinihominis]